MPQNHVKVVHQHINIAREHNFPKTFLKVNLYMLHFREIGFQNNYSQFSYVHKMQLINKYE